LASEENSHGMQRQSPTIRDWLVALTATLAATALLAAGSAPRKGKMPHDLSEILSRMNDAAKNLKTVSADLEYTKVTALVNDKSTETGRLFFRKSKNPEILIDIKKP